MTPLIRSRRLALSAAAVAACATSLAATAGPAAAAPKKNPYTPGQVCGGSYGVIGQHALNASDGTTLGTAYLLYSGATKKNCAVVMKRTRIGQKTYASVDLQKKGGRLAKNGGLFKYYAGPVYVKAPKTCVKWSGLMIDPRGASGGFNSPFEHCG